MHSESEALKIRADTILQVFDHIASEPDQNVCDLFLAELQEQEAIKDVKQVGPLLDPQLKATIAVRTLHNAKATPTATTGIAEWAFRDAPESLISTHLGMLASEQALTHVVESELFGDTLTRVAANLLAERKTRQERKQQAERARKTALAAKYAAEQVAREAREEAEWSDSQRLLQAKDETTFWEGYGAHARQFPLPEHSKAESAREARLFGKWRDIFIERRSLKLAHGILENNHKDPDVLTMATVAKYIEGVRFGTAPKGLAIFSSLTALRNAMRQYYAPRNIEGELLDAYFSHTPQENNKLVNDLLDAILAWDEKDTFKDPLHDSARGGLGDILEYRGSALDDTEIVITRTSDGKFALNRLDVGLYAGTEIRFSDETSLAYTIRPPEDSSSDRVISHGNGHRPSDTFRLIEDVKTPAWAIGDHIQHMLADGTPATRLPSVAHSIYRGIVRPQRPFDYFHPSSTITVGEATIDIHALFHNPEHIAYIPPNSSATRIYGLGYYERIRVRPNDDERLRRSPDVEVRLKGLSEQQRSVAWAAARLTRLPQPGITNYVA